MKRKNIYTSIPNDLYNNLVELSQKEPLLNLEIILGVIGLIYRKQFLENKTNTIKGLNDFVHLDSRLLKKYDLNGEKTTNQLRLLQKLRVIDISSERFNVHRSNGKARGYKIIVDFNPNNLKSVQLNHKISKKYYNHQIQRSNKAKYTTEHLTKWINKKYIKIEKEKAINYINTKYNSNDEITKNKKVKRLYVIKNFENQLEILSREGKDNRLHSLFTSLPSDLKQFVLCNNKKLVELDVKSSQPFVISVILEKILNCYDTVKLLRDQRSSRMIKSLNKKIKNELHSLYKNNLENENVYQIKINEIIYNISNILLNESESINFIEIRNFIFDIRHGDIYEKVGDELFKKQVIKKMKGNYQVNLYDPSIKSCRDFNFSTLRNCSKRIVLNSIYSNFKNPKKPIKEFRKMYPSTMMILDQFKLLNYQDLAILTQRIESNVILDYSTKKMSQKSPNTPLITRHDSVSTTVDLIESVKEEFKGYLYKFFNCEVNVIQSSW